MRPPVQLLTVPQVAARLGCSPRHVHDLVARGAFSHVVDIGTGTRAKSRISEGVLAEYIASRTRRVGR